MRKVVVAGNWKMNKTIEEARSFANELKTKDLSGFNCEKMVFAPSYMLEQLSKELEGTSVVVGCQNMHQLESGAMTGEISADMIKSIGIKDVLVGHSERRQFFNESDKVVNEKMLMAIKKDLNPFLCIGETLEEREAGIMEKVLKTQTVKAFENISSDDAKKVVIAYEPVWAIGTGKTATAEDANSACRFVREVVAEIYDVEVAKNMVIQYGGSVNPGNVDEILSQPDIDGALVGGASLEVDSYVSLLK